MFRKSFSILLAVVMMMGVFTVLRITVNAKEKEISSVGVNTDLIETGASNPYNYYATDSQGRWANCTWWAWQIAYETTGVALPAWSHARTWYASAQSAGYYCDTIASPNSIVVKNTGEYGHVQFVTEVSNGQLYVKEGGYWYSSNGYNEGWTSTNGVIGYIHLGGDPDTHYGAEIVNFDGANASNISFFDATIGCWMRNHNSYNIRAYGFYLGNNQDHLVQYTIGQNVKWTDSYIQANLSDYVGRLSQGVQYYYRFFSLTDGYNLSPVYSFTTSGNSTVTFDNISSSNINNENMSIECWARNHQGFNILKYGLYYGTALNKMNECIEIGNNVSWTDFHISIKMIEQNVELKPNTTYYYQFFALTDGWNFSLVNSFTTGDYVPIKQSGFDVNFWVDGKNPVNIDEIGAIQVYVNGQLQGYGTDFCKNVPAGKPYEVKINISNPDFRFAGVDTSDASYSGLTGTTGYNETKVRLVICKDSGGVTDIPSGNYVIVSAIDTKYGLDIAGDNFPANNKDNVILYPIGDTFRPQDTFTITYLGNGFYSIKQMETDMALDVAGASVNNSANIQMFTGHGNDNQQWKIIYDSSIDSYTIQSKCSGMYLSVDGDSIEEGKNVYQKIKNTTSAKAQGWKLIPYDNTIQTEPTVLPTEPPTTPNEQPTIPPTEPQTTPTEQPTTPSDPAIQTEPKIIILGDVDDDGEVTIIDATAIQRHLASIPTASYNEKAADADGDGSVTILDATAIQRHLAQLLTNENIGKPIA